MNPLELKYNSLKNEHFILWIILIFSIGILIGFCGSMIIIPLFWIGFIIWILTKILPSIGIGLRFFDKPKRWHGGIEAQKMQRAIRRKL